MVELKHNTAVRVNRQQYDYIMGTIEKRGAWPHATFGRIDKRGQCFIKPGIMDHKKEIEKYLNKK